MDWNWFFSSVAQSIAALVGIIAAFVITSVVANQAEFSRRRARAAALLTTARTVADRFDARYFNWYNKRRLESALASVKNQLKKGGPADAKTLYADVGFPPFVPRDEVLQQIEECIRVAQQPPRRPATGMLNGAFALGPALEIPNLTLWEKLGAERDLIDQLIIEAKGHARVVREFLVEIEGDPQDPPLLRFAVVALLALFFVGVVFPLFMLPVPGGQTSQWPVYSGWEALISPKSLILTVSSVIFTGLCVCFFVVSMALRYPRSLLDELRRYTDIGEYSPYVRTMVANGAAVAAEPRTESAEA